MKKTIIYIGGFELPDKNAAAQRVVSVSKILKELNFNVVLLGINKNLESFDHNKKRYFGFDSWEKAYPKNIKNWIHYISSVDELQYIIEKYYKNDLYAIICYNYPFLSQYKIRKFCLKNDVFLISDVTEWYSSKGNGLLFGFVKWFDTILRMRYMNIKSDGLICISKYLKNFYNLRNCNILELPSLFDTKELNKIKLQNKIKYENVIHLMYAGSAYNEKEPKKARKNIKDRLDKIILLLNEMDNLGNKFFFNIFGLEKENYLKVFPEQDFILEKLSKKIKFNGRREHSEIISYIKQSDFTIFIRDIDRVTLAGFPTKFSESICCGTPVITNKITNIEDYLIEGKTGFYISDDNFEEQIKSLDNILNIQSNELKKIKNNLLTFNSLDFSSYIKQTKVFFDTLEEKYEKNS